MAIHQGTLKSGDQTGCESHLRSRLEKGMAVPRRWPPSKSSDTALTRPFSVQAHLCFPTIICLSVHTFSQGSSCIPLLSAAASPARCGLLVVVKRECSSRCCVSDATLSSPEPASHHRGRGRVQTAELVTSCSLLSAGIAL